MLSEHHLRTRLAEALHEQADPVTGDAVDTAGIFARAVRRRQHRRTAVRVTSVLAAVALLAAAWALRPWPARSPASGYQPPGLLLAAAVVRPQPAPAGGHGARLAPLPVPPPPAGAYVTALAVSPDGRALAVGLQLSGGQRGAVEVVQLATGAVRTWTTARAGQPTALSWADHELGFFWQDDEPAARSAAGLWTLDTTAPGSNLMAGRRILPASAGGDSVQAALLGPGGRTAIASVTYDGTGHVGAGTVVGGIVEVSAATGHPLRTLLAEHAAYSADPGHPGWHVTACQLAAIDGSGAHLLVSCDRFGRLDRARFTPLPGSSPQTAVAADW